MYSIDKTSRKAIYEQIVEQIKKLVQLQILKKDDKLPSVRDMSLQLCVNPNTVQKAYRELEQQHYIYTVLGQGSFVSEVKQLLRSEKINLLYEELTNIVRELIYLGETDDDLNQHIKMQIKEWN